MLALLTYPKVTLPSTTFPHRYTTIPDHVLTCSVQVYNLLYSKVYTYIFQIT